MTTEPEGDEEPAVSRDQDVFTAHPAAGRDTLIVRYPGMDDGRLGHSFADAAERLVGTYTGAARDDLMLLPYLYLYRHAMELELKQAIRYAAGVGRLSGNEDPIRARANGGTEATNRTVKTAARTAYGFRNLDN